MKLIERLVAPSVPSLIAMGVVVSSFLCLAVLPPSIFYRLVDKIVGYERSFPERGTYLFGRLTRLFATERWAVRIVIVGGSTTRESFWSQRTLAQELTERTGTRTEVVDLTSTQQRLRESLALAQQVACRGGADIVVLGMGLSRLRNFGTAQPAAVFGYSGPEPNETEGDLWVRRLGVDLKSAIAFRGETIRQAYLAAKASLYKGPRNKKHRHRYLAKKTQRSSKYIDRAAKAHSKQDAIKHRDVFEAFEQTVENCGGRPVYLITPVNPRLLESPRYNAHAEAAYAEAQSKLVQVLTARDQATVINLSDPSLFADADFYDWGHLRDKSAIFTATREIALGLAPILRTRADTKEF